MDALVLDSDRSSFKGERIYSGARFKRSWWGSYLWLHRFVTLLTSQQTNMKRGLIRSHIPEAVFPPDQSFPVNVFWLLVPPPRALQPGFYYSHW